MSPLSPPRSLEPFQRLQVNDGLLITAQRWKQAHNYHRQRQNLHYQGINQGGIVWGLGICSITPPSDVSDEYRDQRWIRIQPGLAIDGQGNPIVVSEPITFRISFTPQGDAAQVVYLSLRYVDPDELQFQGDREFMTETFRIEETTSLPHGTQIELCRILLQPGEVQLQAAIDVFAPDLNQLDLRYRPTAQVRAPIGLNVAVVERGLTPIELNAIENRFSSLFRACSTLYPAMQGINLVPIQLQLEALRSLSPHLLYLTHPQFLSLTLPEQDTLREYIRTGAVIFVEISVQEAKIADFSLVKVQLDGAIANLSHKAEFADIRQELEAERSAMETLIDQQVTELSQSIQGIAQQIGADREVPVLGRHPLRNQPFLFSQFPSIEGCEVQLKAWEGIVFAIGSISKAWGLDESLSTSRETIRAAQEFGINMMDFAWRRYQLTQLQQGN